MNYKLQTINFTIETDQRPYKLLRSVADSVLL